MNDLIAAALGRVPGILPDGHARAHVVKEVVEHGGARRRAHEARQRQHPVARRHVIDRKAGQKADQHRAEVLLQHDQPHARDCKQAHGHELAHGPPLAQVHGQAEHERDLDELRGLDREEPQVDPVLGAAVLLADEERQAEHGHRGQHDEQPQLPPAAVARHEEGHPHHRHHAHAVEQELPQGAARVQAVEHDEPHPAEKVDDDEDIAVHVRIGPAQQQHLRHQQQGARTPPGSAAQSRTHPERRAG